MNSLIVQLDNIGALNKDRLVEYYPKVRDRNDISVLIDPITEVIVLSQCDHVNKEYYRDRKEDGNTIGNSTYISPKLNDNSCRSNKYYEKIYNKCWLDFGCGNGGMLDELSSVASECFGLDPNKDRQLIARSKGHNVVSSLKEISDGSLDVVTMFHVLEHLTDPISTLNSIKQKLKTLMEVGLDYIKIGQSATTLSGGEAQRIKLSKELSKRSTGKTLYILDEPTTGLHFEDVNKLLKILHKLVDEGNTVIVIEHNLDVIKTADYIVDMGPEGGVKGGNIIAEGKPEDIIKIKGSYTGEFLKPMLEEKFKKMLKI